MLIGDFDRTTNAKLQELDNEKIGDNGKDFRRYIHKYCSDLLANVDNFSSIEAMNSIDFNQLKDATTMEEVRIQMTYLEDSDYLKEIDSLNLEELLDGLSKDNKKKIIKELNVLAQSAIRS